MEELIKLFSEMESMLPVYERKDLRKIACKTTGERITMNELVYFATEEVLSVAEKMLDGFCIKYGNIFAFYRSMQFEANGFLRNLVSKALIKMGVKERDAMYYKTTGLALRFLRYRIARMQRLP